MSDAGSPGPRPPFLGIGKRNVAYLVFVALLVLPTDRSGTDAAGRAMAAGMVVILWGLVTLPFAIWNLLALFGAGSDGRSMRKPGVALLLVLVCCLAGIALDLF